MFLYFNIDKKRTHQIPAIILHNAHLKITKRKAKLSPPKIRYKKKNTGTFLFAPLKASLTVEAALVLPIFLFVMIGVLRFAAVMGTASRLGTALADTGKSIAAAAYVTRYGGDAGVVPDIAASALSEVYAQNRAVSQTGDTSVVKNINMLFSSFLKEDETIDLVMTYQIRSPFSDVRLPIHLFIQRARVRAWTGRNPPSGEGTDSEEGSGENEYVYVTKTGSVYHDDPECTHLKLSIQVTDTNLLGSLRNKSGAKYHPCEKCASVNTQGLVYITKEGNKYHSSLSCSGLKRMVGQVSKKEVSNMKACSKCGKKTILDYIQ